MTQVSRRQFMAFMLRLWVLTALPACRRKLPVLGMTGISSLTVVEDHSSILARWAETGIRDAVLINIDTHDDLHWIPEQKMISLQGLYRDQNWQRFAEANTTADRGLYHIGNWIYAGARLGIFREVCWVVPFRYVAENGSEDTLRQFLKQNRFTDADIRTFALRNNRYHGAFRGIPLTICGLESLPEISSPLLLSIDADFLPTYGTEYRSAYLPSLQKMFAALHAQRYQIQDAVVSYSVNGDFLPPHLRWVGDAVAMLLKDPVMLSAPPTERLLLQQEIDNAYRTIDAGTMLALATPYLARHEDASLFLYSAYARVLQNKPDMAYVAAMAACNIDRAYSTGLPFIGQMYFNKGEYLVAERFFRGGLSVNPKMANGLYQFGHCLRKLGKLQEAVGIYEQDRALNGSFPTGFLLVETHLLRNDPQSATAILKETMGYLEQNPYASVDNVAAADAVYRALEFCAQYGMGEEAARLRNHPAIQEMFRKFPQNRNQLTATDG